MRNNLIICILVLFICSLALPARAQTESEPPINELNSLLGPPTDTRPLKGYVRVDAGAALTMDTTLERFFGEPLGGGRTIEFTTGARVGVVVGFPFADW